MRTKDPRNGIEQLLNSVVGDDEPGCQLRSSPVERDLLLAVLGLLDGLLLDKSSLFGNSLSDRRRSTLSDGSRHGG